MDNSTYKALKDWVDLVAKQHTEVEDEWTDIPNVGKFKNLKFVPEPSELDNEITITLKYDNWKQTETGKFIRELSEMTRANFDLDQWLVDDPEHHYYSKHPELIIFPDGKDKQGDRITIGQSSIDNTISVSYSPSKSFNCELNYDLALHCIFNGIEDYRKNSNKEYPPMPCEHTKHQVFNHGTAVAKEDIDNIDIKKGDSGTVTAYLPINEKFAVMFTEDKWITFNETEEDFLRKFEYHKNKE